MYRSVTSSDQRGSDNRRSLYWAQGLCVALLVLVGLYFLFG